MGKLGGRERERESTKMRKEGRKSYPRLLLLFLERGRSEENGYEIGLPSPLAFGTLPACPTTAVAGGGEGGQKKFHPPSCGEKRGGKRKFFLPSLSGGDVRGGGRGGGKEGEGGLARLLGDCHRLDPRSREESAIQLEKKNSALAYP